MILDLPTLRHAETILCAKPKCRIAAQEIRKEIVREELRKEVAPDIQHMPKTDEVWIGIAVSFVLAAIIWLLIKPHYGDV